MLIDFSDVLQICVYELGRTYLRLSQALCINIPSMGEYHYNLQFLSTEEYLVYCKEAFRNEYSSGFTPNYQLSSQL